MERVIKVLQKLDKGKSDLYLLLSNGKLLHYDCKSYKYMKISDKLIDIDVHEDLIFGVTNEGKIYLSNNKYNAGLWHNNVSKIVMLQDLLGVLKRDGSFSLCTTNYCVSTYLTNTIDIYQDYNKRFLSLDDNRLLIQSKIPEIIPYTHNYITTQYSDMFINTWNNVEYLTQNSYGTAIIKDKEIDVYSIRIRDSSTPLHTLFNDFKISFGKGRLITNSIFALMYNTNNIYGVQYRDAVMQHHYGKIIKIKCNNISEIFPIQYTDHDGEFTFKAYNFNIILNDGTLLILDYVKIVHLLDKEVYNIDINQVSDIVKYPRAKTNICLLGTYYTNIYFRKSNLSISGIKKTMSYINDEYKNDMEIVLYFKDNPIVLDSKIVSKSKFLNDFLEESNRKVSHLNMHDYVSSDIKIITKFYDIDLYESEIRYPLFEGQFDSYFDTNQVVNNYKTLISLADLLGFDKFLYYLCGYLFRKSLYMEDNERLSIFGYKYFGLPLYSNTDNWIVDYHQSHVLLHFIYDLDVEQYKKSFIFV